MLPWTEATEDGFVATVGSDRVVLNAPVPLQVHNHAAEALFSVAAGQRLVFVLQHHDATRAKPPRLDAEIALIKTQAFWRDWIGRFDASKTRWPDAVRRSLLTLKAMIHRPTGGLVAAPTTSLPEAPGGAMNWDYRYCWLRDSTFTLSNRSQLRPPFRAQSRPLLGLIELRGKAFAGVGRLWVSGLPERPSRVWRRQATYP